MDEAQKAKDQAERIRRLQERRAASARSKPTPSATTRAQSTEASPLPAPRVNARSRHPAAASRILLAGLSVTSFFSVGGAIALANRAAPAQKVSVTGATSGQGNSASSANAAQSAAAGNAVAHTVTTGS